MEGLCTATLERRRFGPGKRLDKPARLVAARTCSRLTANRVAWLRSSFSEITLRVKTLTGALSAGSAWEQEARLAAAAMLDGDRGDRCRGGPWCDVRPLSGACKQQLCHVREATSSSCPVAFLSPAAAGAMFNLVRGSGNVAPPLWSLWAAAPVAQGSRIGPDTQRGGHALASDRLLLDCRRTHARPVALKSPTGLGAQSGEHTPGSGPRRLVLRSGVAGAAAALWKVSRAAEPASRGTLVICPRRPQPKLARAPALWSAPGARPPPGPRSCDACETLVGSPGAFSGGHASARRTFSDWRHLGTTYPCCACPRSCLLPAVFRAATQPPSMALQV